VTTLAALPGVLELDTLREPVLKGQAVQEPIHYVHYLVTSAPVTITSEGYVPTPFVRPDGPEELVIALVIRAYQDLDPDRPVFTLLLRARELEGVPIACVVVHQGTSRVARSDELEDLLSVHASCSSSFKAA